MAKQKKNKENKENKIKSKSKRQTKTRIAELQMFVSRLSKRNKVPMQLTVT